MRPRETCCKSCKKKITNILVDIGSSPTLSILILCRCLSSEPGMGTLSCKQNRQTMHVVKVLYQFLKHFLPISFVWWYIFCSGYNILQLFCFVADTFFLDILCPDVFCPDMFFTAPFCPNTFCPCMELYYVLASAGKSVDQLYSSISNWWEKSGPTNSALTKRSPTKRNVLWHFESDETFCVIF